MIVIKVNYTTDAPIIKVNYDDAPIYISTTVDATYISVDYGSGAATNAVWGDITGTLSDQTDLQNALDDKVPYAGATGNVDLGEYELKAGQITLDTSPTGTASVGTTRWNDSIGSSETTLKGGSVILKNGVDLVARVVNKVTPNTTLTKAAYQAVRISGAQGQRLAVAFAQANNDNNSADTIGLVTETIATNQEGFIMTVGNLEDINTTGSLQGETWADGDVLYLSPTVAGAITNIKPVAPQHLVVIGYVEYAHANHGKIYVKVMNGWELGELHDVDTTGATAGQVLKYNGTIWTPSSDLDTGITSLNGLTALTQTFATGTSGTDFNISSTTSTHTFNLPTASATNRGLVSSSDWSTFNAKIGGTLATGQVAFGSAANTIAGSANFTWDNTNGRLSILGGGDSLLNITPQASGNAVVINNFGYIKWESGTTDTYIRGGNGFSVSDNGFTQRFVLSFSNASYINTGYNFIIGGTTDSGQRLQVQGDAFIKGSGNTIGTTALTVQNSDGTNLLRIRNDGSILATSILYLGLNASSTAGLTTCNPSDGSTSPITSANEIGLRISDFRIGATAGYSYLFSTFQYVNLTYTSGTGGFIFVGRGYAPTSGTGVFNAMILQNTINQTGGANGITRGLYVNPTLTAAADWRSIEWSNSTGYGLYGAGSALNYIGGRIGLGSSLPSGATWLTLTGPITGGVISYGMLQSGFVRSDVTIYGVGIGNRINKSDANTLPAYYNFFAIGGGSISGAVTNEYGFGVGAGMTNATNSYGFYGDLASGTNRWNLYMNGTANNYMAGSLGVGSTSLTGYNLRLTKTLTGGTTAYGVAQSGQVQSDVTSVAFGFFNQMNTQATSFTLNTYYHYFADGGGIGATSSVTNQIGYHAQNSLTGATNNFGFYGNIASGTGRWNFFANGTAANYLNGNTIIGGSAVDAGYKLDVADTCRIQSTLTLYGNVRDARDNNFIVQSGTGVVTNRDLTIGGGTYGRMMFTSKQYSFTNGTHPVLGAYGFYYNGETNTGAGPGTSVYFKAQTPTATNNNGGDFIIELPTGTGTGRNGRIGLGQTSPTAIVDVSASTTANASLRIRSGTAPTTPNDGDIWFDGTDLKMRIGGVTKTFTLV